MNTVKYKIKKVSPYGYYVIDTSTNEEIWDIPNGCCIFTLDECQDVINKQLERESI
jgi:hypothetical protein